MNPHLLDALYGLIGSAAYNGVHLAWKFTRGTRVVSGTIDLTLRKKIDK
jgi:hypothetical protein